MKDLFNRREAAYFLAVSISTIDRLRANGQLPYLKIGKRITLMALSDLNALRDKCRILKAGAPTNREGMATGGASDHNF